jgi:hypothetical protein
MDNFYVYHLINSQTGLPFYVGKGRGNRLFDHIRDTKNKKLFDKNKYLFYKINKISKSGGNIECKKIIENVSENDAFNREVEEIKKYGRKNNKTGILCNMTDGGEGSSGYIVTNKMKIHLSEKRTQFLNNNPDIKRELIERMRKYQLQGSKASVNIISKYYTFVTPNDKVITIKNLSDFCRINNLNRDKMQKLIGGIKYKYKGYKNLEYFSGKIKRKTNSKLVKIWYEKNKLKFSKLMKEKYNYNLHCKKYKFLSPDGIPIEVFNLTDFCRKNNLIGSCMHNVFTGKRNSHKGWKSSYL